MRVLIGVAVTREMFSRSHHPVFLNSMNQRHAHVGDEMRIFSERAYPDHRVGGIVVDVENGRKCDLNAERTSLQCGDSPLLVGQRRIAGCTQSHLRRKHRRAAKINVVRQKITAPLPEAGARLVIGSHNQRQCA